MSRANLIIIHRGPDYRADFLEIADKVRKIDSEIHVLTLGNRIRADVPERFWQFPTLTVALDGFAMDIKRGPILQNRQIPKLVQQRVFLQNGISTPHAQRFSFGMNLDPVDFGEYVLLKPLNLRQTSIGEGIKVMRRSRAEDLRSNNVDQFDKVNLQKDPYIIQKFIYPGKISYTHRVSTFLGEVMWSLRFEGSNENPGLGVSNKEIEMGDYTQKNQKIWKIEKPDDVIALGRRVAAAFPKIPLLGIDIIREEKTEKLYVLEINAGGNTWHFSSSIWKERRRLYPNLVPALKAQFSAFDTAANALVRATRSLAR